jgi:5'-nucleotidase
MDYQNEDNDRDVIAINNGFASITPIHFDLTDYAMFDKMQNWDLNSLKDS